MWYLLLRGSGFIWKERQAVPSGELPLLEGSVPADGKGHPEASLSYLPVLSELKCFSCSRGFASEFS